MLPYMVLYTALNTALAPRHGSAPGLSGKHTYLATLDGRPVKLLGQAAGAFCASIATLQSELREMLNLP